MRRCVVAKRAQKSRARLQRLCGGLLLAVVSIGVGLHSFSQAAETKELRQDLQALVDATPEGGLLRLEPGVYASHLVLTKPIEIDGANQVTLDAGGKGSVVVLETDGATLRGLRLIGSGDNHDTLDSAVQIRGDGNRVVDNVIDDCLFGVDIQQANGNLIQGNQIRSKDFDLGLRGDSVRLWYARENRILDNTIRDVRDMVVWYSSDNEISRNSVTRGRYALHFMYSLNNLVEDNYYFGNTVGVFLMYSDGVTLRRNRIENSLGPTGMGIGFKETSSVTLEENLVLRCATGVYLDLSPFQPDTFNVFRKNRIGYNGLGVVFHSDWAGNQFFDNDFNGNFVQVAVRGGGSATRNEWKGNRWDDYRGFDRDKNDRGDTPYELYAYADQIWMDIPSTAFFRGSPLFEVIQFLDRLAPFSEPTLVVRDESPRFTLPEGGNG